jgi:hypothetical protein
VRLLQPVHASKVEYYNVVLLPAALQLARLPRRSLRNVQRIGNCMQPSYVEHDPSWDRVQEDLMRSGYTDGLPVIPPTRERVSAMLQRAAAAPDDVVGVLPPAYSEITWRDVAVNAVMAGCAPEYLPVVAAAIAAMAAPEFNLLGIATTTGSAATCVIVNGPIAREIEMNSGANALGPGHRANATIGRAVRLVLQNAAGARAGETDMATLGQPAKYTFCFAENEAESPWPPLHVERGFDAAQSVVTVVGTSGTIEVVDSESRTAGELAQTFAQSMLIAGNVGGAGLLGGGEPLVVMPPEHAQVFQADGCGKSDAKAAIYERALLHVDRLSPPLRDRALKSGAASDGHLRIAAAAADVMIVVAGGVGRKAAYVPTWSGTTKAVSREICGA